MRIRAMITCVDRCDVHSISGRFVALAPGANPQSTYTHKPKKRIRLPPVCAARPKEEIIS